MNSPITPIIHIPPRELSWGSLSSVPNDHMDDFRFLKDRIVPSEFGEVIKKKLHEFLQRTEIDMKWKGGYKGVAYRLTYNSYGIRLGDKALLSVKGIDRYFSWGFLVWFLRGYDGVFVEQRGSWYDTKTLELWFYYMEIIK